MPERQIFQDYVTCDALLMKLELLVCCSHEQAMKHDAPLIPTFGFAHGSEIATTITKCDCDIFNMRTKTDETQAFIHSIHERRWCGIQDRERDICKHKNSQVHDSHPHSR